MPLYPGSALAATYDLPLDGKTPTPKEWWDENSCVWVNALPFDADLNANFLAFEPQILNGSCRYDDFVAKGADGIYRNIEDNSDANMPSLGSDTPATDGGCFGMEDDNNDGECKNITALIDHDTLRQIKDSYTSQGVLGIDADLFPGIGHPKTYDSNFNEAANCANYNFQCAWIKGNLPDNIGVDAPSVSSIYISDVNNTENTDANDTTGKYKLYAKAFTGNNKEYSYPCYYDDGTNSSDPHYFLEDDNYRGVLIQKNAKPTNCTLVPQEMELQYPTNHGGAGWYTSESDDHIDPGARGKLNTLKQQGSSVADVQGVRLTGNDTTNSSISPEPYGYGDGEMWTKARVSQYPSYVNAHTRILNLGDTVTQHISNELVTKFGQTHRDNIIKKLARGEGEGDRTFFYESVPAHIPTPEDAVAQLEYAWVPNYTAILGGGAGTNNTSSITDFFEPPFMPISNLFNDLFGRFNQEVQPYFSQNNSFIKGMTIVFNSAQIVKRVSLWRSPQDTSTFSQSPAVFIVKGSNDGVNYTTLFDNTSSPLVFSSYPDTSSMSNTDLASNNLNLAKNFHFTNTTAYTHYKVEVPSVVAPFTPPDFRWGQAEMAFYTTSTTAAGATTTATTAA